MTQPYMGPTVVEAARARIRKLTLQIEELQLQLSWTKRLLLRYEGSQMLESERIATNAEPFMSHPLDQILKGDDNVSVQTSDDEG